MIVSRGKYYLIEAQCITVWSQGKGIYIVRKYNRVKMKRWWSTDPSKLIEASRKRVLVLA